MFKIRFREVFFLLSQFAYNTSYNTASNSKMKFNNSDDEM